MTTINLKDFYYWYTQDQLIEVSDEVAEVFKADARYEMAYQRRLSRHKAQYSLDCDDGIEYSACLHEPTPQELLERMETFLRLWNALNSLPEIQGRRIDAHIILGKSMDNVSKLYEELISFSDLYDSASFEAKKMIVNQLIRRVDVYRGYQLNITFNFDLTPYIEGDDAVAC